MDQKKPNNGYISSVVSCVIVLLVGAGLGAYFLTRKPVIKGRYIQIIQQNPFSINLSEIEVFSTKGGPNIITPNTDVMVSGNMGHLQKNFVDGDKSTSVYTNQNQPHYILVNLGDMMPIYQINIYNGKECCQLQINGVTLNILDNHIKNVYTSNPFKDQNGSTTPRDGDAKGLAYGVFTCFPPNKDLFGSSRL